MKRTPEKKRLSQDIIARDKYDGDNLYHEIKSDLMIARDISQYGNIDDTTLSKIIKERAKAANPYQTKPSQEF